MIETNRIDYDGLIISANVQKYDVIANPGYLVISYLIILEDCYDCRLDYYDNTEYISSKIYFEKKVCFAFKGFNRSSKI